jgi:putative RecB family exonuclease
MPMSLPLPVSLSPSKVSSFKDCALAFRFSAIDGLPETPSPQAAKGTLVHRVLELLMWEEPPGRRSLEAALARLPRARQDVLGSEEYADLRLGGEEAQESEAEFLADAEQLVRNYFELEDPNRVRLLGTELRLSVQLGSLTLRGIIDRLELDDDGELVVTDYKTGSVPSEYAENMRLSGVHIYAALCERMLGRRPARVQLYYLSKPEAIIATPTEQSVAGVERRADALWSAILRACERDDFRPHPGPLCNYCTFKPYCPAYGGDPAQAAELRGPGTVIEPSLPLVAT